MNLFAQQNPPLGLYIFIFFVVAAFLVSWRAIIERLLSRKPILPYQPRRRVPWRVWDLLAIVFFYFVVLLIIIQPAQYLFGLENEESLQNTSLNDDAFNPVVQLLVAKNWAAVMLGGLLVVLVAPIIEEIFFRVLLQGWLEKVDRDCRRRLPALRRFMPLAVMPVFISALIFASQHFHVEAPKKDVRLLMLLFICDSIAKILSLAFGILLIYLRTGAVAVDFGWSPKKLLDDVRLGLIAFAAIAAPLFVCQEVLSQVIKILVKNYHLFPKAFAPDPIPIFFFALVLGFLYYRTHRAAPSISAHMALNASSLAIFLLWGGG
jgi:membrane protease YdiL (CAAX protease family)